MANFFEGISHGFLALVGFGDLVDPLGDSQKALTDANQQMQNITNQAVLRGFTMQGELNQNLYTFIKQQNGVLKQTADLNNEIIYENIQSGSLFLALSILSIFIIIFYLLLK
jgi:hypothetical protein